MPEHNAARTASHSTELILDGATVPVWVHLIPAGSFTGRDGRGPYLLDEDGVINAFDGWGADIAIDYEHQGVHAADNGQPAPAAGWVKEIQMRADGLWGRVEWTERAAQMIGAKEYRYLSPVFSYAKADGRVVKLTGAGLTNNPNLHLSALNRREPDNLQEESHGMDEIVERLRYLLNLPTAATVDEIAAELQKLIGQLKTAPVEAMRAELGAADGDLAGLLAAAHARINAAPDTATYVPRAEFEAVSHKLIALETEKAEAAIAVAVNGALDAGKILPAQVEHASTLARTDMAAFAAFVAAAPVIAPAGETATHARAAIPAATPAASGLKLPAGYGVDGDSLALHNRATAYMAQHPEISYLAAVQAVAA